LPAEVQLLDERDVDTRQTGVVLQAREIGLPAEVQLLDERDVDARQAGLVLRA